MINTVKSITAKIITLKRLIMSSLIRILGMKTTAKKKNVATTQCNIWNKF